MAPWISLALMIFAGLGLVLRHDMIPIAGFDLGIASAAVGIAGLLMFSGRSETGSNDAGTTRSSFQAPLIVATLSILGFAGYTFSDVLLMQITGETAGVTKTQMTQARPKGRIALRLTRQSNGLFSARANVNGSATQLTVDTGASAVVLLSLIHI